MRALALWQSVILAAVVAATDTPQDELEKPEVLTLWDVGFSLRDTWAALRNDPCPVPPVVEQSTPEPPEAAIPPADEEEQDIVSFEDWRRARDVPIDPPPDEERPGEVKCEAPCPPPEPPAYAINKYNYASPDCSARVLSSSPMSQHASSVLHKSRDRYMLTPCKADAHWVVVELCDEIRIQAMELAVWEFFSGIVRDVTISVGNDEEETSWTAVESFVGKNIRGAQTFVLSQPTAFHRFVRIDFSSHYGSEYYCPVSQLKIFGMNQMEAFKFEQKRSAPREEPKEAKASVDASPVASAHAGGEAPKAAPDEWDSAEMQEIERLVQAQASLQPQNITSALPEIMVDAPNSTTTDMPKSKSDSSESIYAFIVRRLDALEGNSSLVARYVDEQSRLIKTLLKESFAREETAREAAERNLASSWERERMRQEERFGRILSQLEAQRSTTELNRRDTQAQMRLLADELSHERRRGLAQLFILLVVIGLGLVSRSSAIDAILAPLLAGSHSHSQPTSARTDTTSTLAKFRSLSRTGSGRRPPTPTAMRKKGGGFRSISSVDMVGPTFRAAPKKMARTAHLHVLGRRGSIDPDQKDRPPDPPVGPGEWEDQRTEASVSDVEQEII